MPLIKSISGIRGTIGGKPNEGLTPIDIVKFTSAFGYWLSKRVDNKNPKIVVGRDARISGEMVSNLVCSSLQGLGIDVIDLGLSIESPKALSHVKDAKTPIARETPNKTV